MNIKANLVKKISKSGKEYTCIIIELQPGIEKIVFLNQLELAVLNIKK